MSSRGPHLFDVRNQVESRTIAKETPPLWIERHEVQNAFEFSTGLCKNPLEHSWDGENRRSHVKSKTLLFQDGCLPTDPRIFLAERYGISTGRKRAGRSQATEAAADDGHTVAFTGGIRGMAYSYGLR